ncbi:uncharacterized protein TNCV_4329671 [Trichonephila clavipes]|nr:uncharacterized protein TNCV_4329671 [Trichonephila clavipes]
MLPDIERIILHHILTAWQDSWNLQVNIKLHSLKLVTEAWPMMPKRRTDFKLTRLLIGHTRFTHSTGRPRVTTPNEDRYLAVMPKETDGAHHQTCLVSSLQLPVRQFQVRPCTDA